MTRKKTTPKTPQQKNQIDANKFIQNFLGEGSSSSSFNSPTSGDLTRPSYYNLASSSKSVNRNTRNSNIPTKSRVTATQQNSPTSASSSKSVNRNTTKSNEPSKSMVKKPNKKRKKLTTFAGKHKVFKEIRSLQQSTQLLLPKLPFARIIREILMQKNNYNSLRITPQALEAIHESAEMYLIILFQDANRCTLHRSRKTLMISDMQLVRCLRGRNDPGNH